MRTGNCPSSVWIGTSRMSMMLRVGESRITVGGVGWGRHLAFYVVCCRVPRIGIHLRFCVLAGTSESLVSFIPEP